jgi:ribosome silencing factor RsfS/YbeB/iojap
VRVARAAEILAQRHGADTRKARLAGLLHDLARLYSGERLVRECEQRGIPIDAFSRRHPIVLHAPLSAALARERFGIDDREILSAIEKHTLADARMSDLDCIVYLADSLEPGREFAQRESLWEIALRDLRSGMCAAIESGIAHLQRTGGEVAPVTLAALKTFKQNRREHTIADLIGVVRDAAEEKKGEDFATIDVSDRTILADTFVVVTGRSKIQTRAIADEIVERAKDHGFPVARVEGYSEGTWILIDLGNAIVHVFTPDQRQFYNIERLWYEVEKRQAQG